MLVRRERDPWRPGRDVDADAVLEELDLVAVPVAP
jgi:hypothetical protein